MKVSVFFDGGTRVSQEVAAGAAVVYDDQGNEIAHRAEFLDGVNTNNVAEYRGLHIALELALELGATDVTVYGDSELVVRQVRGEYRCRRSHLAPLRKKAWELGARFATVEIRETLHGKARRRDNNERADELCNIAMDQRSDINPRPAGTTS